MNPIMHKYTQKVSALKGKVMKKQYFFRIFVRVNTELI